MDFIWTANLTKLAYLAIACGAVCIAGWTMEKFFGADLDGDIDALQTAAKGGDSTGLGLFYLGAFYLLSRILGGLVS